MLSVPVLISSLLNAMDVISNNYKWCYFAVYVGAQCACTGLYFYVCCGIGFVLLFCIVNSELFRKGKEKRGKSKKQKKQKKQEVSAL